MTAYRIVRSNKGTYHVASVHSNNTSCNSRSGLRVFTAQRGEVTKAGEHMFCTKCFSGKPDAELINHFFPAR